MHVHVYACVCMCMSMGMVKYSCVSAAHKCCVFLIGHKLFAKSVNPHESAPKLSDEHNVESKYSLAKPGGPSRCVNCAGRKWWKTATMIATLAYTICATTL
jgi:hypothetical protein